MRDFRTLDAWKRAHALALRVHERSRQFPRDEAFGITLQLRRIAVAVPTRIVQACSGELAGFAQELRRAAALVSEFEYLLLLAGDLGLLKPEESDALVGKVVEIRRMLFGLARNN